MYVRYLVVALSMLLSFSIQTAQAARDDVLVVVNDNSIDSPKVAQHYSQQREINPENIVHIRVPNQYFITWTDFLSLRDQILRFGICPSVNANLQPAACNDFSLPIYTAQNIGVLTANTGIRYVVTTRGVPTRMTVDNSAAGGESTSVDNYLKFWLARYFVSDSNFSFPPSLPSTTPRSAAFGDGRGMRIVNPAIDYEYIVGRIDGVDLASAEALVDRAISAEADGVYGVLYSSTFGSTGGTSQWTNYATYMPIYQPLGDYQGGWRYPFGLFAENRPECSDYQGSSHYFAYPEYDPKGKAPSYCFAQFNKGTPNETIPGVATARQPLATNALAYFGSLDGQTIQGGFGTLQNWRKDNTCQITLCANAADPAACRAVSTDPYKELNTECVGVANGFIGYNFQSFPVSIYGVWPTGWTPLSVDQNDVPVVLNTDGSDDNNSLWFYQPDEVATPQCYSYAVISAGSQTPVTGTLANALQSCLSNRKIGLVQSISTPTPDPYNPPTYRFSFYMKGKSVLGGSITPKLVFRYVQPASGCPAAPPSFSLGVEGTYICNYTITLQSVTVPVGDSAWTQYTFPDVTSPQVGPLTINDIKILMGGSAASGSVGFDVISVKDLSKNVELVKNGSFGRGHQQTGDGDYAANFLSRLGGTAFWGSLSHHQTGGHSFDSTSLGSLVYFMRGLPLGDAVWLGETRVSGDFYGDPLYSPLAVMINYLPYANDRIASSSLLKGSTVNGRDDSNVSTTYQVDYCKGRDFYICDRQQSWQTTGLSGRGGRTNQSLGRWDVSKLDYGEYTLRLAVTSTNAMLGKTQTFNDYYPVRYRYAAAEIPTYFIAGTIKDVNGQPMSGVSVQVADNFGFSSTVTTDLNGYYYQAGLKNGTYVANPVKTGYSFSVNSGNIFVFISSASVLAKDYTGSQSTGSYSIAGTIKDANGQPMSGVSVQVNDNFGFSSTVTTNINGYYNQAGLKNGTYTANPVKTGYSFSAISGNIFVSISGANVPTKDYMGSQSTSGYSVSGTVKDANGQPMPGVAVQVYGSSSLSSPATTNVNGYYSQAGLKNGMYIVYPIMTGYYFNSSSGNIFVSISGANVSAKDYTGTFVPPLYSISGFVLVKGRPLSGVTVQINDNYGFGATTTTDSSGYYSQGGLKNGMYFVSPAKADYSIWATTGNGSQSINGGNVIGKDFTATKR